MRETIRHILHLGTMAAFVLSWSSCSEEDALPATNGELHPTITLVTSIGGMGDNGYNDLILGGVMDFAQRQNIALSVVSPRNIDEARAALDDYCAANTIDRSLLILGASELEVLLQDSLPPLTDTQSILLCESEKENLPARVHTVSLRRYGAAYLCGRMAGECPEACVVAACPDEPTLQPAIEGFIQGYAQAEGKAATVTYLADDITGFNAPEKAYAAMTRLSWDAFVFPLAGGSASGIYKYVREEMFSGMLVAGMDVDCSAYSTRTPFSLTLDIDRLLYRWLDDWTQGRDIAPHTEYGMAEGYVNVTVNPDFFDLCIVWEDYYDQPDYWQNAYDTYYPEALEKEKSFYENEQ